MTCVTWTMPDRKVSESRALWREKEKVSRPKKGEKWLFLDTAKHWLLLMEGSLRHRHRRHHHVPETSTALFTFIVQRPRRSVATAPRHLLSRAYFLIFARRTPRWLLLRRYRSTEKREMRSYKELDLRLTRLRRIRRRLASSRRLHRLSLGNFDFNWPSVSPSEELVAALLSSHWISRDVSREWPAGASFIALLLTDVEQ
jgi:hypothetical protein